MSDEIKKGYVHKCGKSVKSWKRRWFVLKQNGYLYYYTDASANTEKGKIDVVEAKSVIPWSKNLKGAEPPPSTMFGSNAFCIVASDRIFTCVCEMEGESQSWISAMEKVRGVTDQKYPQPTCGKGGEGMSACNPTGGPAHTDSPLLVAPMMAPPPYTPSPTIPQAPLTQQPPQARHLSWGGAPPPGGAGYAGTQAYPPGQCWPQHQPAQMQANPPPPNYQSQQTYRPPQAYPPQAYPPRGNRPPQPYLPQPQGYANYRPPAQGYPLKQGYPPRPNPPRPVQQYPPQAYPPRPPAFPQYAPAPVHRNIQNNTNVTVVNLAAPQQRHVIIRR